MRGDVGTLSPLHEPQRYERIAERIAAEIRAGRLAPGDRLPGERELARRLEVGRASVREAIGALQVRGVLATRPGAGLLRRRGRARAPRRPPPDPRRRARPTCWRPGCCSSPASPPSPPAAAAATRRPRRSSTRWTQAAAEEDRARWNDGDRRFHRRLAALTGNSVLLGLADQVAALMDQPLWQRLRDDSIAVPGRARVHAAEHRMIYEAIVEGDAASASFYATQHLERVRRYMTLDQES